MLVNNKRVAVIGGGSWGTAIVSILSNNIEMIWWVRREKQKNQIISKKKLKGPPPLRGESPAP